MPSSNPSFEKPADCSKTTSPHPQFSSSSGKDGRTLNRAMSWKTPTHNKKKFSVLDPLAMTSSSNLVSLFNSSLNSASWSIAGGEEDTSSDRENDSLLLLPNSSSGDDSRGTLHQSEIKKGRTRTSDRRRSYTKTRVSPKNGDNKQIGADVRKQPSNGRSGRQHNPQSTKSSQIVRRRQGNPSPETSRSHKHRRTSIQKELVLSRLRAPSLSPTAKSLMKQAVHSKTNTVKKEESSRFFNGDSSDSDDDDSSCSSDDDSDSSGSSRDKAVSIRQQGKKTAKEKAEPSSPSSEFGFNSTTCHFCHKDVGPMVMQCMSCKEAYFCQKCMHKGWWKPHQQECAQRKVDERERSTQERKVVKAHKSMPNLGKSPTRNPPRKSSSLRIGKFFGGLGKGIKGDDEENCDNSNSGDDNASVTSSNNNPGISSSRNRRRLFRLPSRVNQHQMLDGDDSSME